MAATKVGMKYTTAKGTYEVDHKVFRDLVQAEQISLPEFRAPNDTTAWHIEISLDSKIYFLGTPDFIDLAICLGYKCDAYPLLYARVSVEAIQSDPPEGFPEDEISVRFEKDFTFVENPSYLGRLKFQNDAGNVLIIRAKVVEAHELQVKAPADIEKFDVQELRSDAQRAVCR